MPAPYPDLPQYLGACSVLGDLPLPVEVVVPQAWQALLGATASDRVRLVIAL